MKTMGLSLNSDLDQVDCRENSPAVLPCKRSMAEGTLQIILDILIRDMTATPRDETVAEIRIVLG